MRHNFKLFDLAVDKIKKEIAYYIDLEETYFTFWLEAIYDRVPLEDPSIEEEEELDLEPVENDYVLQVRTFHKQDILGLEIEEAFEHGIQVYTVGVLIKDSPTVLIVNFKTKKEALAFHKIMISYIWNR